MSVFLNIYTASVQLKGLLHIRTKLGKHNVIFLKFPVKLLDLKNQGSWDRSRASKVFRMMLKTRSHNNFPRQTAAQNIIFSIGRQFFCFGYRPVIDDHRPILYLNEPLIIDRCGLESPMLHTKFRENRPAGSGEDF